MLGPGWFLHCFRRSARRTPQKAEKTTKVGRDRHYSDHMSETTPPNPVVPSVVPVPAGISALAGDGVPLPIVALAVTKQDGSTVYRPLYMDKDGSVGELWPDANIQLSAAWTAKEHSA